MPFTWQYWTEGGDLSVDLDETDAWEGGHCLTLSGSGVLHCYKTDIAASHPLTAGLRVKGAVTVAVGLTYRDTPDRIEWFSAMPTESTNGWRAYRAQLPTRGGHSRRIARVSLRLAGTGRLGRFTLVDTTTPARKPAGVGGFAARNVGATPGTDGLTNVAFTWTASRDAWYYDVYQLGRSAHPGVSNVKAPQGGWLGRAHRDALFADHVDLTHGAQFGIVPFTQDGTAGRLTAVRIA